MHYKRTLPALLITTVLFIGCDGKDDGKPTPSGGPTDSQTANLVELVNDHRVSIGCPQLIWNEELTAVALSHSQEMKDNTYLSHTDLEGHSPFERMQEANIQFTAAAENIAFNEQGSQSTFDSWMGSAGHKGNIENCEYTEHGVGRAGGYWTHMFMKPAN